MRSQSSSVLQYGTQPPRRRGAALSATAVSVLLTHIALQFILYRGRVVEHWTFGDLVVFFAPLSLALAGYAWVWWRVARLKPWEPTSKGAFVIALTLLSTAFSFWASLLLPFNMYGT